MYLVMAAMSCCFGHCTLLDISKLGADLNRGVAALCVGGWRCSAQVIQDIPG